MLLIILLVLFVIAMALWGAILGGAVSGNQNVVAFVAVLILGIVVFLVGGGVIEIHAAVVR